MNDHCVLNQPLNKWRRYETVDYLAKVQDEALLTSFGIRDDLQSESDKESESEDDLLSDEESEIVHMNSETLIELMHKSQYNWFEFQECVPDG